MDTLELTAEAIDAMEAGEELDALVAEKVMGWEHIRKWWVSEHVPDGEENYFWRQRTNDAWDNEDVPPEYSTDIAAAWLVVEHLKSTWGMLSISLEWSHGHSQIGKGWHCTFMPRNSQTANASAYAPTAPLALCRASLKTVLSKQRD